MKVSDGTLVTGVLNGDKAAFAELYDRKVRLIRAICYDTTRDFQAAADLTQEVFLRSYRNLGKLDEPENFSFWLVGIARQTCREWRRKQKREQCGIAAIAERSEPPVEAPSHKMVDLRDEIAGWLRPGGTLSEQQRLALHAFYLQECDVDQARAVLGLSRSGFYRVLSSAVAKLRHIAGVQEIRQ